MKRMMMTAVGVMVMIAGSLQAQGVAQSSGPTMEQTQAWLEGEGRELMAANRMQTDQVHFGLTVGTDRVESFSLASCTLMWRVVKPRRSRSASA